MTNAELCIKQQYVASKVRYDLEAFATFLDEYGQQQTASVLSNITAKHTIASPSEEPGIFLSVEDPDNNAAETNNVSFHGVEKGIGIKYPGYPIKVKIKYYPEKIKIPATNKSEYLAVILHQID